MAQAYVEELNKLISGLTTSSAHRERVFLEHRLEEVKHDLDVSMLKLSQFSSRNRTFDPQIQGKAILEAAASIEERLISAESELRGLQEIYGPDNVRVKSAQARVRSLRDELRRLAGDSSETTANEASGADGSALRVYPSLEQLPLLGNTYADLFRRSKILEAVYEVLTKQYELAKVQEAKEIPTVKVLDDAVLPERKSWPPRMLIIILGATLSAIVGTIVIYGQHQGSRSRVYFVFKHVPIDKFESVFSRAGKNIYVRKKAAE
jgi:uncharacterized protein involved in exopolysaccharide biosynthesis